MFNVVHLYDPQTHPEGRQAWETPHGVRYIELVDDTPRFEESAVESWLRLAALQWDQKGRPNHLWWRRCPEFCYEDKYRRSVAPPRGIVYARFALTHG